MKKALLILFLTLAGLIAILLAALMIPSVQKPLLLSLINRGDDNRSISAGSVRLRPGGMVLQGLVVEQPEGLLEIEDFQADWQLTSFFRGEPIIHDLSAKGVSLDLSTFPAIPAQAGGETPSPAQAPLPEFQGLFPLLRLPLKLTLERAHISGTAMMPKTDVMGSEVHFRIEGGNLRAGSTAEFDWEILTHAYGHPYGAAGKLSLRQNESGGAFDRVDLDITLRDEVADPISTLVAIQLRLSEEEAGRERYAISMNMPEANNPVTEVAAIRLGYDRSLSEIAGEWHVDVHSALLERFPMDMELPRFTLLGEGTLTLQASLREFETTGGLQGRVDNTTEHLAPMGDWESLFYDASFSLSSENDQWLLRRMTVSLADNQSRQLLEFALPQPFKLDLKEFAAHPSNPDLPLAELKIPAFPLSPLSPLLTRYDIQLNSGVLHGGFHVFESKKGFSIRSSEPIQVNGLNVGKGGNPLMKDGASNFNVNGRFHSVGETWSYDFIELDGSLKMDSSTPATLFEELSILGPVSIRSTIAARLEPENAQVKKLDATVENNDGEIASLRADNAFRINLEKRLVETPGKDPATFHIATRIEPEWINPFLEGLQLDGDPLQSTFTVTIEGKRIEWETAAPARIARLSIRNSGNGFIRDGAMELIGGFSLEGDAVEADLRKFNVTLAGTESISAKGVVSGSLGTTGLWAGKGSGRLWLAPLTRQPFASAYPLMDSGQVDFAINGSMGDDVAKATISVKTDRIIAHEKDAAIPDIDFGGEVQTHETEPSAKLRGDILVKSHRGNSDLKITGDIPKDLSFKGFDLQLVSKKLNLDDLQALAGVFQASPESQPDGQAGIGGGTTPDENAPPWGDMTGDIQYELQQVAYGGEPSAIRNLEGIFRLMEDSLRQQLTAELFGGGMRSTQELKFDANSREKAYSLIGNFSLNGIESDRFFRAVAPDTPASIEGLFQLEGLFQGTGETPVALLENIRGRGSILSEGGVFRVLREENPLTYLGFVGQLMGRREGVVLTELSSFLSKISYDRLEVDAERGASLDFRMDNFLLDSPELQLRGSGQIRHQTDTPVLEQPLNFTMNLAAGEWLAARLSTLGLLAEEPNSSGYIPMKRPFRVGGTLVKPDTTQLWSILGQAAATGLQRRPPSGESSTPEEEGEPPPEEEPSGEDMIRGAIEGLFFGK